MNKFRTAMAGVAIVGAFIAFTSPLEAKHRHRAHHRVHNVVEQEDLAPRPDGRGALEWLGHFSGGSNLIPGADPIPLAWVDEQAVFGSERDCRRWIADMKSVYSTYEGYRTCVIYR